MGSSLNNDVPEGRSVDVSSPKALVEFDHPGYFNSCTMKSGTFGAEDLVFSGNDFLN